MEEEAHGSMCNSAKMLKTVTPPSLRTVTSSENNKKVKNCGTM